MAQRQQWTPQLVLQNIKQLSQQLGKTPRAKVNFKLCHAACHYSGSWNNAVKEAGLTPNRNSTSPKNPRLPQLCPDLAWFVMFLKGDGYVPEGKNFVDLGLGMKELNGDLHKKLEATVESLFGLRIKCYLYKYSQGPTLRIFSAKLNRWLHKNYGKFGTYIWNVPSRILHSKDEAILLGALRGIFDAEGTVNLKAGQVSLSSVNPKALKQIALLLQKVGISSSICGHNLLISGCDNIKRFYEKIGFTVTHRQQTLERLIRNYMNGRRSRYTFINWKQYAQLWLSGQKSAKEIAKELNVDYPSVFRYFKTVLSVEDYTKASKLWHAEAGRRNLKNAKLHGVNLEKYLKQWLCLEKSMSKLAKELNVSGESLRYRFKRKVPPEVYVETADKWRRKPGKLCG